MHSNHHSNTNHHKLSPKQHSHHPASSPPSLSTVSSSSSCPRDDGSLYGRSVSNDSALLLYQAFVGDSLIESCNGRPEDDVSGDKMTRDFNYGPKTGQHCQDSGCASSNNCIASNEKNNSHKRQSDTISSKGNQSDAHPINNDSSSNKDREDESTHSSTASEPIQNSSLTSLLSRHRTKIGTVLISLTSLWIYSRYKRKNCRDYRHQSKNSYGNSDLIRQKLLGLYKKLFQLLSSLRLSTYLRQLTNNRITNKTSHAPLNKSWEDATTAPLSHLLALAKTGNVSKVLVRGSNITYLHSTPQNNNNASPLNNNTIASSKQWSKTTLPSSNPNFLQEILSTLLNHGCHDISTLPESMFQRFLNGPALVVFPFAYLAVLYWMMRRLQKGQLDDEWTTSCSNASGCKNSLHHTTTFEDVAGIDSALSELTEVISYIRNPHTFHCVGATPPRGILLHGPPGSGKTLLARAVAGEAGGRIDCFKVCSGSEFVETYVGRGAARVRSLFGGVREEAWRNFERRRRLCRRNGKCVGKEVADGLTGSMLNAWGSVQSMLTQRTCDEESFNHQRPMAIIFIDEIDALAKRRDSGSLSSSLGGCDEREQTLNQLLTEMDGFATGSSSQMSVEGPSGVIVIVIAATNRIEVLDPAILRAGRFDRHVRVPLPDAKGREAILRVHARRIRYDSSVDFRELAAGGKDEDAITLAPTHNFSGADLKNVINEAALLAVRSGSSCVKQKHLMDAVKKVRDMTGRSHGENRLQVLPGMQLFVR